MTDLKTYIHNIKKTTQYKAHDEGIIQGRFEFLTIN